MIFCFQVLYDSNVINKKWVPRFENNNKFMFLTVRKTYLYFGLMCILTGWNTDDRQNGL